MAKQQFQAESKRLLDMMINSIYTHKEIFLRELISNASDAVDKRHFRALTNTDLAPAGGYEIRITPDEKARTLTIEDNGIGMTQDELEHNLGVIAQSGSLQFKKDNDATEDVDIIGQFGVGFYSAFMVASHVTVISRSADNTQAYRWDSDGADGFEIIPTEKDSIGTQIILTMKESSEEENYDDYLQTYTLQSLIKKYSDYIRYPIRMVVPHSKVKPKPEDAPEDYKPEYETVYEDETLNSMIPLWKKPKGDITEEEYNQFYSEKFFDFMPPAHVIHTKTEGLSASYSALLFIPQNPPYDYYSKDFKRGLQLYASGVLIMDKCEDLIPEYYSFVRGLVDSPDLSLNISREILQHDRQLKAIALSLEKKIHSELLKLMKDDREKYVSIWKNFGLRIKVGAYDNYGANKEKLRDLMMFYSANEQKYITLQEYREKMPEEQEEIYYAAGASIEKIDKLPQAEAVRKHGFDILYLTDDIDEFVISVLGKHDEKSFRSIASGELDLSTEDEKKETEKKEADNRPMFDLMKEALNGKVKDVRLSSRLVSNPVCLTTEGNLSIEMEKVLNALPDQHGVSAEKILELNSEHPIFATLCKLYKENPDKLKLYTSLLYTQTLLIEGMPIEDPAAFSDEICKLMAE